MAGSFSMGLRRLTGRMAGVSIDLQHCMFFDEYVDALEQMHRQGNASLLNMHFKPQHMACPVPGGDDLAEAPTFVGTIHDMPTLMRGLHNFGFKSDGPALTVERTHVTPRGDWVPSAAAMAKLCRISKEEYEVTNLPIPAACVEVLGKRPIDAANRR
jgi:hypothetical protein